METSLEVNCLEKKYKDFSLNVSLSIFKGETLALVGPNGSGKTTLIRCLLNIVRRDGGEVRLLNRNLDQHEVAIKQRMGVFLEDPRLFEDLRIKDTFELCSTIYAEWDSRYAESLLEQFEIDSSKRFKHLSKGMKAKAALIIALAPKPEILILDEPTSGLDPGMRRLFIEKVREAKARFNPSVLLTSHIMKDVDDLADRIAFIENGRIRLCQSRASLLSWKVIEGVCDKDIEVEAVGLRPASHEEKKKFHLLTDRYGEEFLKEIKARGAEITSISSPDLEEIYSWVISRGGFIRNKPSTD